MLKQISLAALAVTFITGSAAVAYAELNISGVDGGRDYQRRVAQRLGTELRRCYVGAESIGQHECVWLCQREKA